MLTIFNRAELAVTFDMARQGAWREALSSAGIRYEVSVKNRLASPAFGTMDRARLGSFGLDQSVSYEYKFYVRKGDLELAQHVISEI